ncbi:hypothetical protein JL722_9995 [Aureococcus anophagefferens]|nr:hypothetical protein JL722_9995 [Aureococcus anophagefferens]
MARSAAVLALLATAATVDGLFGFGEKKNERRSSFAHLSDAQLDERISKLEMSMRPTNASAWEPRRLRLLADLKEEVASREPRGGGGGGGGGGGLERCLARAERRRTAGLTHVKPQHLVIPQSRLRTPEAFARALKAAGFHGVVTIRRQNHLARLVSSFENRVAEWGLRDEPRNHSKVERRALKFFAAPLRTMEWEAAILERGHAEMARLGMAAVELDFVDVVAHVCAAVAAALVALVPGATSTCVEQVSHMAASKRHEGLAGRATAWPDGALRPEPVAHPDGPRPRALRGDVV